MTEDQLNTATQTENSTTDEVSETEETQASTPAAKPKRVRKPKAKAPAPTFKLGDKVKWSSQANGVSKEKVGDIVEVVDAGQSPTKMKGQTGAARPERSYVILANKELYWPRTSALAPALQSVTPSQVYIAVENEQIKKERKQLKKKATKKSEKKAKKQAVQAKVKPAKKTEKKKAEKKVKVKKVKAAKVEKKTAAEKRAAHERTLAAKAAMRKREEPNDDEKKVWQAMRVGSQGTTRELADRLFPGNAAARYLRVKNAWRWLVAARHYKKVDRGTYERLS